MEGNEVVFLIFKFAVLIFSVIVHEVSHGLAALRLGDDTAKRAGRITLNPLPHLELFGSFLLPMSLFLITNGAFVIGWAKPVPYDPARLRKPKIGSGIVAAVGPLSNILVATIIAIILRFVVPLIDPTGAAPIGFLLSYIVYLNLILAVFNLVPLPPLDGSGILFSLLPERFYAVEQVLRQYGFVILIMFIFFGFNFIIPVADFLYSLLVGGLAVGV